jgi:hypothetical protein
LKLTTAPPQTQSKSTMAASNLNLENVDTMTQK